MSTHLEMFNVAGGEPTSHARARGQQAESAWLLRTFASELRAFVSEVPGVTHAVLLSQDGLRLLDNEVGKDWADELSAALSVVASLAANITGPTNKQMPPRQVVIERDDCLFLVQSAGRTAAFKNHPGITRGVVDMVIAVITTADTDAGTVGYEMGRLLKRFAPYMRMPVCVVAGDEVLRVRTAARLSRVGDWRGGL
ncbi:roadblock/LC7 domain-containing protein [Streptomyces sp. NPDC002573]|uniref:roadblock/LC7 domain-containing protein n=1 Tax=Streptomyces sp. NPDC002573 TaxID=3364651 RepID=UPI003677F8A1